MEFRPDENLLVTTKKKGLIVKVGDVVSFSLISNKKRGSRIALHLITRIRQDLSWADVISANT